MLDEEEQEAPMPATDHVAEAKFQFADNLRRIQLASRDLGTRGTSSFDLLKKVQFSEDEVRSLIRETLDKSLSSDKVSHLLVEKYNVLVDKYDTGKKVTFEENQKRSDKETDTSSPHVTAKESIRKKAQAKVFFDLNQIPDEEKQDSYWNSLTFEDIIRCNAFLRYLTFQQIQSLENSMTLERLPAGQVLANEGDTIPFGIIKSGKVEVSKISEKGREEGRLILRSGDVFGYEFVDFDEGAEPEAISHNTYRVVGDATIYFCSMASMNKILYAEQDDISHWISKGLDLWCCTFSRASMDYQRRLFVSEFLSMWQNRLPVIDNYTDLLERLDILFSLISPDLNFRDNLEDIILKLRPIFNCDRCSFYTLDVPNNLMYLFTVDISKTVDRLHSNHYDNSNQLYGLRMPMKGIAAQVAKTGRPLNLTDCYMSEYFDSAMDIRTGYLSKQMLCVPVINRCGDIIGVIQFINTNHDSAFSVQDEILASFLSTLLSPVLDRTHFQDISGTVVKPSTLLFNAKNNAAMSGNNSQAPIFAASQSTFNMAALAGANNNCTVTVHFHRLLTLAEHRHMKFTCRCVEYGNDLATMRTSIMYSAQTHVEDVKIVELNTPMQFTKLEYGRLTPASFLLVEFFSKNNHPCGWTLFPFFTSEKYLQQGVLDIPVFYGNCPPDWLILGNIYATAQRMRLYDREESDRSIFLSGMCSGSLLLELHPEQTNSNFSPIATSGGAAVTSTTNMRYFHEFSFAIPPCHFTSYMLHRYMVSSTLGDLTTWTIPEWLMTLQLPETRRRKFATALCAHFMVLSPDTLTLGYSATSTATSRTNSVVTSPNNPHLSTFVDAETQQFLWEQRESIQQRVPQLFPFFVFTLDWSLVERQQWLLSTLHKWNRLSVGHLLPLLDVRFGHSPLHVFATSSLWSLSSTPLYLLRFLLITLSQAQWSADTSLSRFLMYRMFSDSYHSATAAAAATAAATAAAAAADSVASRPFALPFLWQQLASIHFHSFVGIKDSLLQQPYWQWFPKDLRAMVYHGLLFFLDVHQIYASFVTDGRFNVPPAANTAGGLEASALQEALRSTMLDFKAQLDALWPGDKPWLVPLGNVLSRHPSAHQPNIHHVSHVSSVIVNQVEDVRMGSYFGKDTFVITLHNNNTSSSDSNNNNSSSNNTTTAAVSSSPCIGLIYLPHVNYRLEHVYHQVINVMNFIFLDKQIPLHLYSSEIYPLAYDRVGNMCKEAIATYLPGVVSLNYLIVDAMKTFQKANKTQNTFQLRKSADPVMTKIPDDLLLAYYAANIGLSQQQQQRQQSAAAANKASQDEMETIVRNFMPNLVGFLLVSHVLSLQGVNTSTTFVDRFGMIFTKNIASLLNIDASVYNGGVSSNANSSTPASPKSKTPKRQALFYLPCFLETIGGTQGGLYRDFQQLLLSGFRALRDHAPLLLWSIRTILISHELPLEDMQNAVIAVRESLMLDITDDIACQQLQEQVQRGLKADYQLKMK